MATGKSARASGGRMERERRTVQAMIELYCRHCHRKREIPCEDCRALAEYAAERLDKCPFQEGKTTCARCPVHCYRPEMREQIRTVMRYAGPRMLLRHPLLSLLHQLDALRGRRERPSRGGVR